MNPGLSVKGQRGQETEYEEQIRDLELFIPKERKCRGHMDVFKYLENFCVKRGSVFQGSRAEYT